MQDRIDIFRRSNSAECTKACTSGLIIQNYVDSMRNPQVICIKYRNQYQETPNL